LSRSTRSFHRSPPLLTCASRPIQGASAASQAATRPAQILRRTPRQNTWAATEPHSMRSRSTTSMAAGLLLSRSTMPTQAFPHPYRGMVGSIRTMIHAAAPRQPHLHNMDMRRHMPVPNMLGGRRACTVVEGSSTAILREDGRPWPAMPARSMRWARPLPSRSSSRHHGSHRVEAACVCHGSSRKASRSSRLL